MTFAAPALPPQSPPHKLDMFSPNFFRVKVPQQPVIIRNEAVQFPVPFPGQPVVQFFDKGQQRALWRKALFVPIDRRFGAPPESFAITCEAEPIEKVFSTYQ